MTPRPLPPLLRRILDYARDRTGAIGPLGLGLGLRIGGGRPPGGGGNGGNGGGESSTEGGPIATTAIAESPLGG